MEERDCIVCGKPFPLTRLNRQSCSHTCAEKHHTKKRREQDEIAKRSILEPPLYSKTELFEARIHIKTYSTPELAKGREYVIIKAQRIIDYWKTREETENRVFALRKRNSLGLQRYKQKKKEMKNVQTTQPVS